MSGNHAVRWIRVVEHRFDCVVVVLWGIECKVRFERPGEVRA